MFKKEILIFFVSTMPCLVFAQKYVNNTFDYHYLLLPANPVIEEPKTYAAIYKIENGDFNRSWEIITEDFNNWIAMYGYEKINDTSDATVLIYIDLRPFTIIDKNLQTETRIEQ